MTLKLLYIRAAARRLTLAGVMSAGLAGCAGLPGQSAPDRGGQACPPQGCRDAVTINLMRADGSRFYLELQRPPATLHDGAITIFAGERHYIRVEPGDTQLRLLERTSADDEQRPTLEVALRQNADAVHGATMLLTVRNPFDRDLRYRLAVQPLGAAEPSPIPTCAVPKGAELTRRWKGAIVRAVLSDFRFATVHDNERACGGAQGGASPR